MVLAGVASALVVDGYQEWTDRTQLADIGGLEITGTGHAKFTARVDQDAVDVTIAPGGILENLDTYKLPDDHPEPTRTNVYVNGTWNANNIESKGTSRAAYIYVGATGVITIQIGYGGTAPYENPADYDPLTWLADNSLLVDPSLDPAAWSIQITDMGGGAAQITAEALAPKVGFDSEASGPRWLCQGFGLFDFEGQLVSDGRGQLPIGRRTCYFAVRSRPDQQKHQHRHHRR